MDPELSPVVVAVGRTGTGAGIRAGAAEARRTRRPLRLMHVAPRTEIWQRMLGREALADAVRLGRAEVRDRATCEGEMLRGDLLPLLTSHVSGAALVVLERPVGRHVTGRPSTTVLLAEALTVPTLVVPAGWCQTDHAVVTVGLDPAAADDVALRTAVVRARLTGSVLRVVVSGTASVGAVARRLDGVGGDACDLVVDIVREAPFDALLLAAASSDLVVLGRHHLHLDPSAVPAGGVGCELVQTLPCPVLLPEPGHTHPHHHDAAESRGVVTRGAV